MLDVPFAEDFETLSDLETAPADAGAAFDGQSVAEEPADFAETDASFEWGDLREVYAQRLASEQTPLFSKDDLDELPFKDVNESDPAPQAQVPEVNGISPSTTADKMPPFDLQEPTTILAQSSSGSSHETITVIGTYQDSQNFGFDWTQGSKIYLGFHFEQEMWAFDVNIDSDCFIAPDDGAGVVVCGGTTIQDLIDAYDVNGDGDLYDEAGVIAALAYTVSSALSLNYIGVAAGLLTAYAIAGEAGWFDDETDELT